MTSDNNRFNGVCSADLSSCLYALCDQDVRAGALCRFSLLRRSHLVDHENACVAETFYHTWNKLPEQRDNRNSKVNAHVKLTFEQLASVAAGMRFTPNRWDVARRTASTSLRIRLGGSRTMPRNPNPPALVIAATSSERATPPMPARTTGYLQSSRSQTRVDR